MELFSGDNTSDHFPEMISPFPPSFDSCLSPSHPTRGVATSLPPQKLRPIRCNGKTNSNTKAFQFQHCAEFGSEDLGRGVGELGFVGDLKGDLKDDLQESCEAFRATEVLTAVVAEVDLDMDKVEKAEIKRQDLPAYSSSTSKIEASGDPLENAQGSHDRKRRKTTKTLEGFMEKLASKVLLKQEMMQNELMEMIERKERERFMREDAWKKQEMERLRKEEQVRAQETARNVALITLIKNIMDKDLLVAKPSQLDNLYKYETKVYQQRYD